MKNRFKKEYGEPPKNRHMRLMYDMLADAYYRGWANGYDASNAAHKKKAKR